MSPRLQHEREVLKTKTLEFSGRLDWEHMGIVSVARWSETPLSTHMSLLMKTVAGFHCNPLNSV